MLHVFWVVNTTLQAHQHLVSAAALAYAVLITVLVAGSLTYLSARYGYARRVSTRRSASDSEIDTSRMTVVPSVTILVPSYKEDPALVWKTLFSAALQDYPRRSVVLLIDDPPVTATREDARALDESASLPKRRRASAAGHA
jgi:cellulose synthase/poly-beta-1,6-N-acetylglucosamine synthase-like glycosyltransferase